MKSGNLGLCLAAAGMLASPVPATAQEGAKIFKPTGQWALDYGDDYCRLARTFSDGKDDLALAIERIEPGPFGRLIVISNGIHPFRSADEIGWHFTPADAPRKARYTRSTTGDGKQYYNLGPFAIAPSPIAPIMVTKVGPDYSKQSLTPKTGGPPVFPSPPPFDRGKEQAAAKGMTGLILDSGLDTPAQIDTGELGSPIAALQACADDLAKSWGLDPAKLQGETAAAIPDKGGSGWLPQGTVPFTDFGKLAGGSNQVRLMVDATGKATSCTIHWPTLDAATNDKICKAALANAKFAPAKDVSGQPMPGYWMGSPLFMGPPIKGFGSR